MSMGDLLARRRIAVPAHVVPVRGAAPLKLDRGQPKKLCGRKPLVIGEIEGSHPVGLGEHDPWPGQLGACGAVGCVKAPSVLKEDFRGPEGLQVAEVARAFSGTGAHVSIIAAGPPSNPGASRAGSPRM